MMNACEEMLQGKWLWMIRVERRGVGCDWLVGILSQMLLGLIML
jgi:hypothetical protein